MKINMRKLGVKKREKVMIREINGKMIVEPVADISTLKGVFKTDKAPLSNKKLHELFAQELTSDMLEKI